jgi:predicted transcriptional regulator
MTHITIRITDDMKKDMEGFPEINWSVIARKALKEKIKEQKKIKAILEEINLTEEEGEELSKQIKKGLAKKYKI